jgi:multidrug efflux pump subunit AcrA (membrane-fusion protein)
MNMSKYLFILCIVFLFGCSKKEEVKEEQVRPVKAIQVSSASDQFSKGLPSVTQETREVELSFRISGPLIQLNVEEGQAIKKGELIAEVDPKDFKVNLTENSVLQADENLDLVTDRYNEGLSPIIDVLNAQIFWESAYQDFVNAKIGFQVSYSIYQKALGLNCIEPKEQ